MTLGYHTIGQGPEKLLFLHGWLSDHLLFEGLFPLLDGDRYTAVFADYRGYGLSSAQKGDYTIDEIAGDMIDLLGELGWQSSHIIGHSMGGMVVQKIAKLRPDLVISGVAVTPVPASGFEMDADTAAFFQSSAKDDAALENIFNILTGERHADQFLKLMTASARKATTTEAYLGYLNAWTTTDFSAEVTDIKTDILVVAGAHDGALGPEVMRNTYLKQLKNVNLVTIDGAGHYPTQEAPIELFTILDKHLKKYSQ